MTIDRDVYRTGKSFYNKVDIRTYMSNYYTVGRVLSGSM